MLRRALDRVVAVGYGVVYDFVFDRFPPYRSLQQEVLQAVERTVDRPDAANRRDIRILELGCGPGHFAVRLAEAGFSVVGLDRYGSLIDLAREKRQARHLVHLSFQHGDLAAATSFRDASFDLVVNIHSLYVHPAPSAKLREAYRVLKAGGHAIFVNPTRRLSLRRTFRELRARESTRAAIGALVWLVPNAVFEAGRHPVGPSYWSEDELTAELQRAGFAVLETRRTFLNGSSVLVLAQRPVRTGVAGRMGPPRPALRATAPIAIWPRNSTGAGPPVAHRRETAEQCSRVLPARRPLDQPLHLRLCHGLEPRRLHRAGERYGSRAIRTDAPSH